MPTTSSYTFKILLEGKGAIAEARRIRTELERELGRGLDFRQAQQQMADVGGEAQTTAARMAQMQRELRGTADAGGRLEVDLRAADEATRQMVTSFYRGEINARELENALRGGEQAVQATRQEVRGLGSDLQSALAQARRETQDLRTLAAAGGRLGRGMMTTGMAILGPLTLAGRSYLQFADDANRAGRQLKLNAELTAELKSETLDLSASLGLFTPEEISQGLYTWASAIGAVAENQGDLDRLLQDSVEIQKLAAMNQENLGTTTEFVAAIMGEFGMDVSQTRRVVELLNFTADRTQATVADLGQSFKYLGPMAHALGEDVEDVAAVLGVAADAGIKQSQAGRAVRQMYVRLSKPTKEMSKALNQALGLSEELGQSWEDIVFQGGQFQGTAQFIDLLAAATENMTEQQRMALLAQIATANELPVLTALVMDQVAAREAGINSLRAWKKQADGLVDAEVRRYAEWREATRGITISLEDAHTSWVREWLTYEESDTARADRMAARWSTAFMRVGKAAVEVGLPMLEELADALENISRLVEEHPEMVDIAIKGGGALLVAGAGIKGLATAVRLYADARMLLAGVGGLGAAAKFGGVGLAATGGLAAGAQVVSQVRGETVTIRDALGEIWEYTRQAVALTAGYEGMVTAWLLGKDPIAAYESTTYEVGKFLGLIEEIEPSAKETGDELKDWNVELERARRQTQGLGSDLMQIPEATETGLAAFTEAELEAIDELESYLRRRNDMIEEHNQGLADMQADFLEKQAEQYKDYMNKRADLERELREVSEEPLWRTTKEAIASAKRQREATEEFHKRVEKAIESHQKKLRNLRETHKDRMEDLEARRDAKGILAERRRYGRAVRDAGEQKNELIDQQRERLEETLEDEREKIATMREERKADLEDKLRELDENYQEENAKRQLAFEKEYADRQAKNARDLQQLERSHAERLARIMSWEDRVRAELRQKYFGQEADLRVHLAKMQQMYRQSYDLSAQAWTFAPLTGIPIPTGLGFGMQAGGYAGTGMYRLGEAGREFVLNAPTTRAMERAMGSLSQGKMMNLAGAGGYLRMDIRVKADDHFSPAFAKQTEAMVQAEIARLATSITQETQPGAYRPH